MPERRGSEPAAFVRYDELHPDEARRMRAMVARAEQEASGMGTDPADASSVRYAISAGPLPGNSIATLVIEGGVRVVVLGPDADDG